MKKFATGLLVLGAASILCGFDSAETADDIIKTGAANLESADDISADIGFDCDISIIIGDEFTTSSISALLAADFDIEATAEPNAYSAEGYLLMSIFGQNETLTMKYYGITNEDDLTDTFEYFEDSATDEEGEGTWNHSSGSGIDIKEVLAVPYMLCSFTDSGFGLELTDDTVDYNGIECYLLSTVIDYSDFWSLLETIDQIADTDLSYDSDVIEMMSLLDGININIEYYADIQSCMPVAFHIDFNDCDLSAINEYITDMIASSGDSSTVEIVINDLSLDFFASYEDVETITAPPEAYYAILEEEDETGEGI